MNMKVFLLALVLFLFLLVFHLPLYNYTAAFGDLGEYLNNPLRVLNGEMPYRDFWLLFPPGEVYLPALLYKIFGLNVNVILISLAVTNALIGVAGFIFGKTIFKNNMWGILTGVLLGLNGVMSVYALFLLIAATFFVKYLEGKNLKALLSAGIFIGFAFYFRFFEVGAACVAFGLVFIAEAIYNKMPLRKFLKFAGAFLTSVLLTVLIIYLPLWSVWPVMFKEIVFETLDHGTSMNLPYFYESRVYWGFFREGTSAGLFNFGNFLRVSILYFLPFVLALFSLPLVFNKKIIHFWKILASFLLLWATMVFLKAMGRSDIPHLVHSLTPLVILLLVLVRNYKNLFLKVPLILLVVAMFLPVPLKVLSVKNTLAKDHYPVTTAHGTLLIDNQNEAESVNEIVKFVLENTETDDFIFVTSWFTPPIYALTARQNPTYYDSLIDIVSRPSEEEQQGICDDLLEKKTSLIVHNADWGFDGKEHLQFRTSVKSLDDCIKKNFKFVEKIGNYELYIWSK